MGKQLLGLLDSGTSKTIVGGKGWKLLQELGLSLTTIKNSHCTVANGDKCTSIGSVSTPVKLIDRVKVIDILVIPELPHVLILGIDFWHAMQIVPDLRNDIWTFSNSSCELSYLQSPTEITLDQKLFLENLTKQYFQNLNVLGCTSLVEHVILTDSPPIKQRYYPVSPKMQSHIDSELKKMLDLGIVEKSTSAWSSPILLVPKKDGTYRFCVDYRKLNKVTKKDAYPLPYISNILDKLRNATYLSSLDIRSAYWQVPVSENSREFTAFTVPGRGLYQFKRMPFGLSNSPATFQRLLDRILGPELEPWVFVYLDDIIVVTTTFEKHCEILKEVLERLTVAGLTLSQEKCKFCLPELKYLGYVVDKNGLHVDAEKVNAILNIPTPKNVSEVRRVIGMASWYRRFLPEFSSTIAPMTALLKKKQKFVWSDQCEQAFKKIKNCLVSAPVLTCPDFNRPFTLQTDASGYGVAGVLSQNFDDGERVICYLSRSLTKAEKNYSSTERELLAIVWCIEKLRPYLEGSKFSVITDHHSLIWLNNLKNPTGRLARWAVRLQQYDFTILHRKGKDHVVPDLLSRAVPNIDEVKLRVPNTIGIDDKWYTNMCKKISSNPLQYPQWRIADNKLFKYVSCKYPELRDESEFWKEVVPKRERKSILENMHCPPTAGHLGIYKTYNRIINKYYWPKMRSDVTRFIKSCKTCQEQKPEQKKPRGLMVSHPKVSKPFQMVSADLVGPLPRSSKSNVYVLVIADYFSKYVKFFPIRKATASTVTKIIENDIYLVYGVPQYLIVDNGVQFRSKQFAQMCKNYKTKILYNALYHAQANPTERVNRVMKTMISSYVTDLTHRNWDLELPKLECAVRTARHEVTGYTPHFIVFGREYINCGTDFGVAKSDNDIEILPRDNYASRSETLEKIFDDVSNGLKEAYNRSSRYYNLRRRGEEFFVGEKVLRKNYVLSDAAKYFNAKLAPKYIGPFIIKKKVSPWTYELASDKGHSKGIWHAKDLKLFFEDNTENF